MSKIRDRARAKSGAAPREARRRVAIGPRRPQYMLNEENDRMMMIISALAAEVSTLRDRLDTHEALGERRRFATAKSVEGFKLDAARRERREHERRLLLSRLFRVLLEEMEIARSNGQAAASRILSEETAD